MLPVWRTLSSRLAIHGRASCLLIINVTLLQGILGEEDLTSLAGKVRDMDIQHKTKLLHERNFKVGRRCKQRTQLESTCFQKDSTLMRRNSVAFQLEPCVVSD